MVAAPAPSPSRLLSLALLVQVVCSCVFILSFACGCLICVCGWLIYIVYGGVRVWRRDGAPVGLGPVIHLASIRPPEYPPDDDFDPQQVPQCTRICFCVCVCV